MKIFNVRCYTDSGHVNNGAYQKTEAKDRQGAAEKTCGGPLIERKGSLSGLRAEVTPVGNPKDKTFFYKPDPL